jgi:HlyD family secretion protein
MFAKVVLNEVDAANVQNGQPARLTFDALGGETVNGTVTNVDTIGTIQQNVVSYAVEITFDQPTGPLKPGMSVDVEILTAEKNDILLVPNAAVKSDESGKYVLIPKTAEELADMERRAGGTATTITGESRGAGPYANLIYRAQRVETGLASETQTEIVSGLKEGDTVVTRVPTTAGTGAGQGGSSLIPSIGSGRGSGIRELR